MNLHLASNPLILSYYEYLGVIDYPQGEGVFSLFHLNQCRFVCKISLCQSHVAVSVRRRPPLWEQNKMWQAWLNHILHTRKP